MLTRAMLAPLVLAGVWAGCGSALPAVTAGDAARSGVALAELQQGRSLVAAKCSGCHHTPLPTEHRPDEWPRMVSEMALRAHVEGGERQAIRDYLVAMATR